MSSMRRSSQHTRSCVRPSHDVRQGNTCQTLPNKLVVPHAQVPEECPVSVARLIDECLAFDERERPSAEDIIRQLASG